MTTVPRASVGATSPLPIFYVIVRTAEVSQ